MTNLMKVMATMAVMLSALLMGVQPAAAQAPAGLEKTHRQLPPVSTDGVWGACIDLFGKEKATAKCWINAVRVLADGTVVPITDFTAVQSDWNVWGGIPTPVLQAEAMQTARDVVTQPKTVETKDEAKAGVVPAPGEQQALQDTVPSESSETTKPQSNVLPETTANNPPAALPVPTPTDDTSVQTPWAMNPETSQGQGITDQSLIDSETSDDYTVLYIVLGICAVFALVVGILTQSKADVRLADYYYKKTVARSTTKKSEVEDTNTDVRSLKERVEEFSQKAQQVAASEAAKFSSVSAGFVDHMKHAAKKAHSGTAKFFQKGVKAPKVKELKQEKPATTQRHMQLRTDRIAEKQKKKQSRAVPVKKASEKKPRNWKLPSWKFSMPKQLFAKPSKASTSPGEFAKANEPLWDDAQWLNAKEPVATSPLTMPDVAPKKSDAKRPELRVVADAEASRRPEPVAPKSYEQEVMEVVIRGDILMGTPNDVDPNDPSDPSHETVPVTVYYTEDEQLFDSLDGYTEKYTIAKLGALIINPRRPSFTTKYALLIDPNKVTMDMKNNPEKIFVKVPGKGPYAPSNFARKAVKKVPAMA